MAGAKRGCLQAQITADEDWIAVVSNASGGPDPITVLASGATAYLPEILATFVTEADLITGASWSASGSFGESGTGRVTIDNNDPAWSVTWTSTSFRNALGFTGNISAVSAAQTGANHATSVWLPDSPKWTKHGDGDSGDETTDLLYTESPLGDILTTSGSATKTTNMVRWSHVSRRRTRTAGEVVTNESWQTFWRNCHRGDLAYVEPGAPVRLIWDADVPGTYATYKIVNKATSAEATVVQGWNGLYAVELELMLVPS